MSATLSPPMFLQFQNPNNSGSPAVGFKLFTYQAGTSVKQPTWTDSTQLVQNANPLSLDGNGVAAGGASAAVWGDPSLTYKFVWAPANDTDPPTSPIRTIDNITFPISLGFLQVLTNQPILASYARTAAEIAAGVTPVNYAYTSGDIRRYGASVANTDNGIAINQALSCNQIIFDGNTSGPIIYQIKTTLKFTSAGQIFLGAGFGDNNTALGSGAKFAPRTTLKWTGAAGSTMILLSDGVSANWSETTIRDIYIDGNALLNKGIAYDDTMVSAPGCWRNSFVRVGVGNCNNGSNPCAIYLGNGSGAGGFCNDPWLQQCYLWNCGIGVYSTGAVPQLLHCTIGVMSIAGLYMPGANSIASETKLYGGVFHNNQVDILTGSLGLIQNVSCFGVWFENSAGGIFVANASFSLHMFGCHLHTLNAGFMFNFNGQAGHAAIKCWVAAGTSSFAIINPNAQYDYDTLGTGITIAGVKEQVRGLVNVDNAKFFVAISGSTSNSTGDGTVFAMNASAVTKFSDLASAVNASTGVFTCPATGFYEFVANLELTGVTSAHNDAQLILNVTGTSAGTYLLDRRNPGTQLLAGGTETHIQGSAVVPMTSGDTAYISIMVSGSTKVVGVLSANSGTSWRTNFQGRMA